jgi:hypothetical protein
MGQAPFFYIDGVGALRLKALMNIKELKIEADGNDMFVVVDGVKGFASYSETRSSWRHARKDHPRS